MASQKNPPTMDTHPSPSPFSQSVPQMNSTGSSFTTSTSMSSVAGLEVENHVHGCRSNRPAHHDTSDRFKLFRMRGNRASLGMQGANEGTPLQSDVSDTEDDVMAKKSDDAVIRPYLKGAFETYDQGDVAEDVSPELEVAETLEEDVQSATGEEASEISKSPQPIGFSDINLEAGSETRVTDIASETAVLDETIVAGTSSRASSRAFSPAPSFIPSLVPTPTPSPIKHATNKTNSGLASISKKYPYPKFTPLETFENYLQNPAEMSYEELYHKTSKIAQALVAYQDEYDTIDQKIIDYETAIKAETRRAVEDGKEESDRIQELEDYARDDLEGKYHEQLQFGRGDWQVFLKALGSRRTTTPPTLKHLNNLRNPAFMEAAKKRRNRTAPKPSRKLQDEPIPEHKLTKEESDFEKRKLGRLVEAVKFEDMKMADIYGFEYSSHPSHYGNQPLDKITRQPQKLKRKVGESNVISENDAVSTSTGRLRAQRTKTKRPYDVNDSGAEEGEDGSPAKRARRPRAFEDGATGPRASPQTSGLVPAAKRTFPSGKRVGRPPKAYSQSKLQAVQTAQESPDFAGGDQGVQMDDNEGDLIPYGAAEALGLKRKHPGGRPKKVVAPSEDASMETSKPRNKGGRPRKIHTREMTPSQDGTVMVSTVKKEPESTANMVQLGDADDVMQSTEVDEASRGNSPAPSRPSSSASYDTASSFGGAGLGAQASTRTKTLARELSTRSEDDDSLADVDNSLLSSAPSSKDKRKRATAETEPSPIVVETPSQVDEPSSKRRRTKAPKADLSDEPAREMGPKRKRKGAAAHGDSGAKKAKKALPELADEEVDSEGGNGLSPQALKELAAKKAQSEKSKKLSASTKARWASGGMQKAQETRRANLAIKKAAKEAAAAAAAASATAGSSSSLIPIQPAPPAMAVAEPGPAAPKQPKEARQKTPPLMDNGRAPSARVKRPTRIAAGFDGAADDFGDLDDFPSEYDRYQALTSAESPGLGKRVRRPLVDLSAMMGETSDEDYY